MKNLKNKVVFFDRDGVICPNRPDYVKSWEEFVFLPGVKEALKKLKKAGFQSVVISNQSCIGRGIVSAKAVDEINLKMVEEIEKAGGEITRVYVCPHRIDEGCDCRKPKTGLFKKAAEDLNVKLSESYLIGDAESDILSGKAIGVKTVLVLTGLPEHPRSLEGLREAKPDFIAEDLGEAADWILDLEQRETR